MEQEVLIPGIALGGYSGVSWAEYKPSIQAIVTSWCWSLVAGMVTLWLEHVQSHQIGWSLAKAYISQASLKAREISRKDSREAVKIRITNVSLSQ